MQNAKNDARNEVDLELIADLKRDKYIRPERRQRKAELKAAELQATERTELAPDAPAPHLDTMIAEVGLEPTTEALAAWNARLDGAPIVDIAHTMGVSILTARKLLNEVYEAIREDLKANLELNRQLDLSRIDQLISTYLPAAKAGEADCARVVLKCLQHRAELTGVAAPKASTVGGGPQNVLVWIQQQLPSINRIVDALPLP